MSDHYRALQVRRDASPEVIAAAYRRLMRDAHPDAGGDAERARRLNDAYAVLSDPDRRRAYDRALDPEPAGERPLAPLVAYRVGRGVGRLISRLTR